MNENFRNFEDVESALKSAGDIMSVTMEQLRDACGAGRLGVHVRAAIEDELESRGICHQPDELPNNQRDWVRLYRTDTRLADLVKAITAIGDHKADDLLRSVFGVASRSKGRERPQSLPNEEPLVDLIHSLDRAESRRGEFVALKWFRNVALPAETFEWGKSEGNREAVLREAISRGIVLTSKVPNPLKPQFPVTSIRLNRGAPEVREALRIASRGSAFSPLPPLRNGPLSETVVRARR